MASNRDLTLDIAKAICIILMVVGHSGCPAYLDRFIYMFHMPCFFFVSGWLLSDKYVADPKRGLLQKVKGIYWPFVKWQLIFMLLHNLFVWLNFFREGYTLQVMAKQTLRILTMMTTGQPFLGGFWFIISLFWASVFTLLFAALLQKRGKLTVINISGGVILALVVASTLHFVPFNIPDQFNEVTIMATAFYMTGFICRKWDLLGKIRSPWVMLAVPAVVALFCNLCMQDVGVVLIPYYFVAVCGTIGVIAVSQHLARSAASSPLSYIGSKTLYILVFHLVAFKAVSWIYIILNDLPTEALLPFPIIDQAPRWLWIAYSVVGISVPLLLWELNDKITLACKKLIANKISCGVFTDFARNKKSV